MKKSQKYPEVSIQHDKREATSVVQDINRTLNKQFIQVSNSSAAVCFIHIWKSEDELQFCVNYCDLNWITWKNHYSLSLIYETLWNIKQAQWYIKLNVIAAFHKIWIAAEDKWKTAFHKVQVVWMNDDFFELVNVSEHLSKIYQLSLAELSEWVLFSLCEQYSYFHWWIAASHRNHVQKILLQLWEVTNWHWQMWVWSQVNQVSKVHSESEKEHTNESSKDEAIMNWQAFKSVKSVQSFIDFANFYWKFIKNFSNLIMSMMALIKRTHL
jgi:hypothetical protein